MSDLNEIIRNINNKNFRKALKLCEQYENNNNTHIILNMRGAIYHLQNNLEMAESCFIKSFKINNKFLDPLKNLYIIYNKEKKIDQMINIGKKLTENNPLDPSCYYKLGFAFDLKKEFSEAIKYYEKCIDLNGRETKFALNNIGNIFLKKNQPKNSLVYFLKALNFDKRDKIIINNLLSNYLQLKDKKNSNLFYNKAKEVDENFIEFQFNKAEYLISNNNIDEAIEILESNKKYVKFLIRLIKINFTIGKNEEAKILLKESKEKIEKNTDFLGFLGMRNLFDGDFENGWKYYEYRPSKHLNILNNIKEWKGEDLKSKHILVYCEQGLGDTIQFSKYIFPLLKISGKVTLVMQKKILNIFRTDYPNLEIIDKDLIKNKSFDFKITLGSILKFFFKEKLNKNETLIISDKNLPNKWSDEFDSKKINVGLAWSGSPLGPNQPYRSIPLKALDKILSLDFNFYCLQNEIWERDLNYFKSSQIKDFGKYDFKDLSLIIPNLDLVISVDTSLLHLSASLNKETWGIFDISPDWRWGKFKDINPYETLKFFKQEKFNNWDDVVENVFRNLKEKIKI